MPDPTITDKAVTELKVGDRVQLEDQGLMSDYGTVIEPPKMMYEDDPGPRVRVERAYDSTEEIAPLVSEVRRIPPDEEQEIWLQRWIVTGEQICDDPDEYNHAHMLFVHEGDLPEIIRTYLAANGLTAPGKEAALPHLASRQSADRDTETAALRDENERLRAELEQHQTGESYEIGESYGRTAQANSCVRDLLDAVYPGDPMPDRPLDTVWEHLLNAVRAYAVEVGQLRSDVRELRAGQREAIAAELESIASDDTGWAIAGYLRKRAASLRGGQ